MGTSTEFLGGCAGIVDDIYGVNFVNGANGGNPQDDNGHGSFVAGVVGAVGNNGIGISGLNQVSAVLAPMTTPLLDHHMTLLLTSLTSPLVYRGMVVQHWQSCTMKAHMHVEYRSNNFSTKALRCSTVFVVRRKV